MAPRSPLHRIETLERRDRWFPAIAGLLIIAMLGASWIGLFAFMGANAAYGTFEDLQDEYIPDVESMELALPDLSQVSRIYATGGELLAELHDGRNSEPVPIDQIPEVVQQAILAAEDREFYEHEGIDFRAIASAALDNIVYDTQRGGSTITQQLVKKNFVGDEISIRRKIEEAFVSAELERRYPKDQILEFYLNSVYFGSGAYGVKTAAEEFYGVELSELTLEQATTLSVLIRNPSLYDPRKRPDLVADRRDAVIDIMVDQGWATELEASIAKARRVQVIDHQKRFTQSEHVVAQVRRQLLNDPEFAFLGSNNEARKKAIFGCPADDVTCYGGGGLRIETTLDLALQNAADEVLRTWLPLPAPAENLELCRALADQLRLDTEEKIQNYADNHSCAPTGAIASVDNATGAIKVMASALPFEFTQFDLAVQGKRNPGSAFKPFGTVAALENGITLGSYYDGSSPIEIQCQYPCSPLGNVWRVNNAGGSGGVMTLERATTASVNTVYAQVSVEVGPQKIVEVAHRMGIKSDLPEVYSLVLGSGSVSPLEMASAYSNFATNGLHAEPYLISRILDADGNVIYEREVRHTQVGDPAIFASIRRPLTRVPTSAGTAPRADIGRPQGGKTGTHQEYRDAWFVGFVPQYSTAVWVGYEADQLPLRDVVINGQRYSRVFGGTVPAPIWADFMQRMLANVPVAEFPEDPPGTAEYFKTPTTIVPSVVGLDVATAETTLRLAKLSVTIQEVASLEPVGTVVAQSLEIGTTVNQGAAIVISVSTGETPSAALPGLAGLTFEQAVEAIRLFEEETGVNVTLRRENVDVLDPAQRGRVIGTNPPAGAVVQYGAVITALVGS
ncbi:MAG: transglycosylase domain-containing protein [Acidimicrobiia bacterium]|jgi:penicillin-binding protein 1A